MCLCICVRVFTHVVLKQIGYNIEVSEDRAHAGQPRSCARSLFLDDALCRSAIRDVGISSAYALAAPGMLVVCIAPGFRLFLDM